MPSQSQSPSPSLTEVLTSTTHLLSHFSTNLSANAAPKSGPGSRETAVQADHLQTLRNSSSLLKAHATKLGLLLLNKPFTPTAVIKVLSEITGTCLPAMMSALEQLSNCYGSCVERELRSRVRQVNSAVGELVDDIKAVAAAEASTNKSEVQLRLQNNSTLASTAQTWSACDALTNVSPTDIVVAKAESYRALLRDAIDELKEWIEEEDEGYDDGDVSEQDSDVQIGPLKCPADNKELKTQVEASVKKLALVEVGIRVLNKKRLKTLKFDGNFEERTRTLDDVMLRLKSVSNEADELAGKFYDLDAPGADESLHICCSNAVQAAQTVRDGWAEHDEDGGFAEWFDKWKALLSKPPPRLDG